MLSAAAMSDREQIWLMIAMPHGPEGVAWLERRAYARARSGKSWYRHLWSRESAIACKRDLVAAGIRYKCLKILKPVKASGLSRLQGEASRIVIPAHNNRAGGRPNWASIPIAAPIAASPDPADSRGRHPNSPG